MIVGGVAMSLSLWISTSSIWSVRGSIDNASAAKARSLVNSCAEIALENMRQNMNYSGSGSFTVDGNTCDYTVTNTGGDNRTISVSGVIGSVTRRLQISTSAFNPITISSWQEVP